MAMSVVGSWLGKFCTAKVEADVKKDVGYDARSPSNPEK